MVSNTHYPRGGLKHVAPAGRCFTMRNNIPRLRATVAANVRAELGRVNCSQSKAAAAIDMSQAALSKRLAGRLPFTVDELGDLADFLAIPVDVFFVMAPKAVSA